MDASRVDLRTVVYEKRGPVAWVTLNRPRCLNAYNMQMRDDLWSVLGAVRDDTEVRAVVLRGAGRAFSSGGDVAEFGRAPSAVVAREARWRRDVWGLLASLPQPTIAAVHGCAVGSGFEMVMLCDMAVAAAGTWFALPETGLGMIPGAGGTQTLPRAAGLGRALRVVLAGGRIDAREALRIGLVVGVVKPGRLTREVARLAGRCAALPAKAVRLLKVCVRRGVEVGLREGLALEARSAARAAADLRHLAPARRRQR